jgi:hypothetical protein
MAVIGQSRIRIGITEVIAIKKGTKKRLVMSYCPSETAFSDQEQEEAELSLNILLRYMMDNLMAERVDSS